MKMSRNLCTKVKWKNGIKWAWKRYAVGAMGAMAFGLMVSLVVGLILGQFAKIPGLAWLEPFADMVKASSPVVGAAVGAAIAWSLKAKPLTLFTSVVTGALGYMQGGPVGAYFAAVVGAELGSLVEGRTKVDIVLVPLLVIVSGGLVARFVGPGVSKAMLALGNVVNTATQWTPLPMGMLVAGLVGMVLTSPISSAGLCIALNLTGLAAGAATAGCSAQMVGFAAASFRDAGWGGLLGQAFGTSKLQLGNVMKRPAIWIAPTIAGVVCGALSTAVFGLESVAAGAGMGTSGLVGPIVMWGEMQASMSPWAFIGLSVLLHFVLPAAISLGVDTLLRKIGWVKKGDMRLVTSGQ